MWPRGLILVSPKESTVSTLSDPKGRLKRTLHEYFFSNFVAIFQKRSHNIGLAPHPGGLVPPVREIPDQPLVHPVGTSLISVEK